MLWVNQVYCRITNYNPCKSSTLAAEHSLSNRHTDRKLTNKCGGWWYSSRRSQSSYLINCLSNCYWLPSIPFSSCCCSIDNFVYTREPKQPGRKGVAATVVFDLTIQPSSIHLMIPPTPPHHSLSDTLLFRRCPPLPFCGELLHCFLSVLMHRGV